MLTVDRPFFILGALDRGIPSSVTLYFKFKEAKGDKSQVRGYRKLARDDVEEQHEGEASERSCVDEGAIVL